jgi:hypothetical protein
MSSLVRLLGARTRARCDNLSEAMTYRLKFLSYGLFLLIFQGNRALQKFEDATDGRMSAQMNFL